MIDWKGQCAAVIPCFNEAARIAGVVAQVKQHLPRVIVVDDCSTDGTVVAARRAGAEVLVLSRNRGKGAALRAGWSRARRLGCDWVLMLDGDGQHLASDIPKFFEAAETTGNHLVVGNRMDNCQAMPWVRRLVNRWMSCWISGLTGAHLPDSQCGFRLARLETLSRLVLQANRFEIESAMLVAFCRSGSGVGFVPVETIYEHCNSKINPITDTMRWLHWRWAQERVALPASGERFEVGPVIRGTIKT